MTDKDIDSLLKKIHSAEKYFIMELQDHLENSQYRKSLTYLMKELKLIRKPFNDGLLLELTPLGKEIMGKGGWIQYQKLLLEKEERANKKEIFDFNVSKFKYHTFWWFFAFAIIGFGLSIFNFIRELSPSKDVIEQNERIKETQSELIKLKNQVYNQEKQNSENLSVHETDFGKRIDD